MRLRIKQVPDDAPNADGAWVEREADDRNYQVARQHRVLWSFLNRLCEPGHHAVSYEVVG